MMKKLLLSSVIVFGSFVIVSAQTGKSNNVSKAQNSNVVSTKAALLAAKQPKTELQKKQAIKNEQAVKAVTKAKPKAAMSLVEAQQ